MKTCSECGQPIKKKPKIDKESIDRIIDYLNRKTGKQYKSSTPSTVRLIQGRLNEGFNPEDFKTVIDNQTKKWGKDPKMAEYLRPNTLFSPSKFESYLNNTPEAPQIAQKRRKKRNPQDILTEAYDILCGEGKTKFDAFCQLTRMAENDKQAVLTRYKILKGEFSLKTA